jgi:hypothetical protein
VFEATNIATMAKHIALEAEANAIEPLTPILGIDITPDHATTLYYIDQSIRYALSNDVIDALFNNDAASDI